MMDSNAFYYFILNFLKVKKFDKHTWLAHTQSAVADHSHNQSLAVVDSDNTVVVAVVDSYSQVHHSFAAVDTKGKMTLLKQLETPPN